MPFRAIATAMKLFGRNRNRIRDFARRPQVANALKYAMMITMLTWLAVALFNSGDDGRLQDAIDGLWSNPAGEKSQPLGTAE